MLSVKQITTYIPPKQALSYLTPLYHHYPIFNHYHCYPLSFDLLNQWIGENDHCIQRESIEENLYRSFELKRENSIGEKDHRTKINWISDLAFLFDKREMGEEEQGRERGLILNSCFPHFLEALSLDQFNYLLCYGNHPFGMGNYFLLWSKLPLPIESSLQSFPLFLYKEGIKKALFRIQKSKILRECLNKLREELSIIKYLDRVSNVEGRDFFYKITLKNSIPPTSTSRIFVENASFLTDKKKILYLSLPLYLQLNHLKGKLTKAFTTLSHFIEDK